jgi:hypothetical protein
MNFVQELESKKFKISLILDQRELPLQFKVIYRLQKT